MSDEESPVEEKKFFAERAKTGRATCKKCKQKLESGKLRVAKSGYNPFGPGPMKLWHHLDCLFEVFSRQRATTARINHPDDIEGWDDLEEEDKAAILKFLPDVDPGTLKTGPSSSSGTEKTDSKNKDQKKKSDDKNKGVPGHKDNAFREFRRLLVDLSNENTYTGKTAIIRKHFESGSDGDGFKGDIRLWVKLLLPGVNQRVYNLKSKQLVKLFSRIFSVDQGKMLEDLEQGDVAATISTFFEKSKRCQPCKKSTLTLQEVDQDLEDLSKLTKEDDQVDLFTRIAKKCTTNDLMIFIRLIKHDLRINAGPKHILEAVHSDAYEAFQTSRDLNAVLSQALDKKGSGVSSSTKKSTLTIGVQVMTPVLPMLAEACKSVQYAMKKCPNGMYSEIKYDGERVQVHKRGNEFKYFSRSLKPVMPHKVNHFKDYIPQAFPSAHDLILDSEVLMVDTKTGKPLPFGTLGVHKRGEYKDASVCLFVFDCIYYNGESLLKKPMKKRRDILHEVMTEIPNHVMFSEMEEVYRTKDLEAMITKVFKLGLEGLVLKDFNGQYEPGKRHWLKVKKDYLFGGAMADTADLVVLGAWFGTGQKGGMMSVFLMGCWDPAKEKWCTVTKVHTGHDDKTLERLQSELQMKKISKDQSLVPSWLKCTKTMIPDFVAKDPKAMPVWEITGAEFTQHDVHTADGISIRFPRVTKIRDDKTWETATSLPELKVLYQKSKENTDFSLPSSSTSDNNEETQKKTSSVKSEKEDSSSPKSVKGEGKEKGRDTSKGKNEDHDDEDDKTVKSKGRQESSKSSEPRGIKKFFVAQDKPSKRLKSDNESDDIKQEEEDSKFDRDSRQQSPESQPSDVHKKVDSSPTKFVKGEQKNKEKNSTKRKTEDFDSDNEETERHGDEDKPSKRLKNDNESNNINQEDEKQSQSEEDMPTQQSPESQSCDFQKKVDSSSPKSVKGEKKEKYTSKSKNEDYDNRDDKTVKSKGRHESSESSDGIKKFFVVQDKPSKRSQNDNESDSIKQEEEHSKSDGEGRQQSRKFQSCDVHKVLPDVFEDVKIVLPDYILEDRNKMARYFIAYGGEVLAESDGHLSSHVIHKERTISQDEVKKWPTAVCHVHVSWLIDSIKLQKKQDIEKYIVTIHDTNEMIS